MAYIAHTAHPPKSTFCVAPNHPGLDYANSQAVRIPREFQLDVSEVEILRKRLGNLVRAFELLTSVSSDFFDRGRKQPKMDRRPKL